MKSNRANVAVLIVCVATFFAARAIAQSTQPGDEMNQWFRQLADRDADVRDAARVKLMSMPRARLDDLKRLVKESKPLAPSQAVELRDIVRQVFLASETYQIDARVPGGFMGVRLENVLLAEGIDADETPRTCVVVTGRIPGFPAYPVLRDGDVIRRLIESNRDSLDSREEFIAEMQRMPAGRTIQLDILRGGKAMRVAITLSVRAQTGNDLTQQQQFTDDRDQRADEYWNANFATLVEERLT